MHPLQLLYGNDPFLIEESATAIQRKISEQGADYIKIHHPQQTDWLSQLRQALTQPSLFSPSTLIHLQFHGKIPTAEMTQCAALLENRPDAVYILIQVGYLTRQQQQAKWFEALKQHGTATSHWTPSAQDFPKWVQSRAKQHGLSLTREELNLICYHTEGNCLAAAQEIDLRLLAGDTQINLADQNQFDVFDLIAAALQSDKLRVIKILKHAKETDEIPLQLVLWALANSLRALLKCFGEAPFSHKKILKQAGIPEKYQSPFLQYLTRGHPPAIAWLLAQLTQLDQSLKTGDALGVWERLVDIFLIEGYIESVEVSK